LRSLEGEFSRRVRELDAALRDARLYAEADLDFSDQDIDVDLAGTLIFSGRS
jgi:tRNA U34 5-carboxymethylaminomethyl modifying GTPase MnmE/TrmE